MAGVSCEISKYRHLLVYLSEQLLEEDVETLRNLMKDQLGRDYDRSIHEPMQLFDILEKRRLMHEGDVGILAKTLPLLGRQDLSEEVENYEQEQGVVSQKQQSKSSGLEGPFFGRDALLQSVIGVLNEKQNCTCGLHQQDFQSGIIGVLNEKQSFVHVVCISGMPGAGKTRLAYEACYRLIQYHQLVSVDLREITTVEAAFFAILHRLGVESKTYEPEVLFSMVKAFRPQKADGAILLLDSADYLLDPGTREKPNINYEPFVDLLRQAINIMNYQLKIVITSRTGLDKSGLSPKKVTCFSLEGDNELDMEDGVEMIRYHAHNTEIDRATCEGLVRFCGKVPLAIRVLGSRLQDGNIKPTDLLKYLENTKTKGRGIIQSLTQLNLKVSDQLSVCLESSIKALPSDHRNYLIRLAVIPGTFSIKAARDILDVKGSSKGGSKGGSKVELQMDLQSIMRRSLLESDRYDTQGSKDESEVRYSMHLLLRSFIQHMVQESEEDGKTYREAEKKFISHYGGKLRKICNMMETDYVTSLSKRDVDHANYQEVLRLLQESTRYDSAEIIQWLNMAVSHLMVPKNRRIFFQKRAQIMKEQKNMHSYADYKCHEMYELMLAGEPAEPLLKVLKEAEKILNSLKDKKTEQIQLSLALCYQVRADVMVAQGRLAEDKRRGLAQDAQPLLENALKIRKKYLGDHFLTARTLLSLGQVWQNIGVLEYTHFTYVHNDFVKALDHYQEALDMVRKIAGSMNHMEMPNILVAMGACMHEMGRIEKAIELYKEALALEEALGVSGTEKTCLLLKNIAMSYYSDERFEDALRPATRAMEGRKDLLETHQQTARAVYFVGLINMQLKHYKEARRYFDEALALEEDLWRQGKQHSEDWPRLKERIGEVLVFQDKEKSMRKYHRRFMNAEKKQNQAERNPEDDKSEEEEDGFSPSSEEEPLGRKRQSSTSASSLHSGDEKVAKLETPQSEGDQLAAMMGTKGSISEVPQGPPMTESRKPPTSLTSGDVSVEFIRASDSDFDDHDSIEECYGINPRRGPYIPEKNKKKSKKAPKNKSSSDDSDPPPTQPLPKASNKLRSSAKSGSSRRDPESQENCQVA